MKRNSAIQILRAVAALLVVYTHTLDLFPSDRQSVFFALKGFGACGVDIFFAISGFILTSVVLRRKDNLENGWDFLMRRFIRIFPIYWIASFFFLVLEVHRRRVTLPFAIESYLLIPPPLHYPMPGVLLGVGWTLIFEMFFYYVLALNLCWPTSNERTVARSMAIIVGLVLLGLITGTHHPVLHIMLNPINLEFVGGGVIAFLFARFGANHWIGNCLMLIGALGLIVTIFTGYGHIDFFGNTLNATLSWQRVVVWGIPAGLLTAGLVFRSAQEFGPLGKLWIYLGDASYSIYLSSGITFYFCALVLNRLPSRHPDISILVVFLAVTTAGAAMYSVIEQPLTKFLLGRYGKPAVQSAP